EFRYVGKTVDPTDYLPYGHTGTLLPDGNVLLAGGTIPEGPYVSNTAGLFDPVTDTFVVTGSMLAERASHSATLLPNGEVIAAAMGFFEGPTSSLPPLIALLQKCTILQQELFALART